MTLISNLIERKNSLQKNILQLEQIINDSPSGNLVVRSCHNGAYRYSVSNTEEGGKRSETYLNLNKRDEISMLANKSIAKVRIKDLTEEIRYIDSIIEHNQRVSEEEKFVMAHPGIQPLMTLGTPSAFLSESAQNWSMQSYNRNMKYPEFLKYSTVVPGLLVRSKAEADIVSILANYQVPFHYDEIVTIGKIEYAMDFICLNVKNNKIWYWDHQGMLDKPDYISKTLHNQAAFLNAGFIPWINMIVTTETKDVPLDLMWVDNIVKYYLVN